MKTKHVFFFLLAAGIYALGFVQTTDPDLWWHLKTGEVILRHGVPHADPFSYTVLGKPWTAHEWLSEVILRLLFGLGGLPALMFAFAFLGIFVYSFVYRLCSGKPYLAGFLTFFAFLASRYLWGPRPQIFNILMLAVFMWLIQSVRMRRFNWKWLYALPFLTVLWANLHSGYLLGIVVLGAFLIGDAFQVFVLREEDGTIGKARLKHFAVIIPACLLAAVINPAGYKILVYPFETLGSQMMQSSILEWQTPTFHHWNYWPFLGIMALGVFAFMVSPPRRNVADFLLFVGSMATGLYARRHIPFFAIVAVPIISKALWDAFPASQWRDRLEDRISPDRSRIFLYVLNPLLVLLIFFGAWTWTEHRLKMNDHAVKQNYPVKAVQFFKERKLERQVRVFNEYVWGGYLIWRGVPVFIDGRADLYGDKFFSNYLAVHDMKRNWRDISFVFNRFRINGLLMRPAGPMASIFRTNRDWQEIYQDRTASFFIHKSVLTGSVSGAEKEWNGSKSGAPSSSKTANS